MPVFVKAHKRGPGLVKAYKRSSIYRGQRLTRTINKIGSHLVRTKSRSHFNRWNKIGDKLTDMLYSTVKARKAKRYATSDFLSMR